MEPRASVENRIAFPWVFQPPRLHADDQDNGGQHECAQDDRGLKGVEEVDQDKGEQQASENVSGSLADVGLSGTRGVGAVLPCPPDPGEQDELGAEHQADWGHEQKAGDGHLPQGEMGPWEQVEEPAKRSGEHDRQRQDEQNGAGAEGQKDEGSSDSLDEKGAQAAAGSHPGQPCREDDPDGKLVAVEHHQQLAHEQNLTDLGDNPQHQHSKKMGRQMVGHGILSVVWRQQAPGRSA
jgi:hypothetical protein